MTITFNSLTIALKLISFKKHRSKLLIILIILTLLCEFNNNEYNHFRIAIVVHDYHDYCRGQKDLVGSTYLYTQLLKARGYDLIMISYENFSIQDKIDKRINYLKQCMSNVQKIKSI